MTKNDIGITIDENLELNKCDVPFQMLYDSSHIEIFGRSRISFEGNYKIVEYTNEIIRIKNRKGNIVFNGEGLTIGNIQKNSFYISGKFTGISFN